MSRRKLTGNEIEIIVEDKGAELISLKCTSTGKEYMWNADPQYWGKTSPILFPFVGGLRNNQYRYKGRTYTMSKHGFAREMEFKMISQTDSQLWFELVSDEETLEKYPFSFRLRQGYKIEGRTVKVCWQVYNDSRETMYFSLGGHPAFFCPPDSISKQTDCYLTFDTQQDEIISTQITPEGLAGPVKTTFPLVDGKLQFSEHLFDDDALVIEGNQAKGVDLADKNGESYLRVKFDAPLFGIWSPAKIQAPFVCIEPWYGRCDAQEFNGSVEDREWGNHLEPDEVFEAGYEVILL